MATKPKMTKDEYKELERLETKMLAIRELINEKVKTLCAKYGDSKHYFKLHKTDENGNNYVKIELIDNSVRLRKKEILFKAACLPKRDYKLSRQKTEPKG